jgi:hypothetical protein
MWKNDKILNQEGISLIHDFALYLNEKVVGKPMGMVRP